MRENNMDWVNIPGYNGIYQANILGQIRVVDRWCNAGIKNTKLTLRKGRVLKPAKNLGGYSFVSPCLDGTQKPATIHRLVCLTFLPNPENKPTINHINGIKTDNRLENLEWATYSENELHSSRVLGKIHKKGGEDPRAKLVYQYSKAGILLNTFPSAHEAAIESKMAKDRIRACANKKIVTPKSRYIWRYEPL